MLTGPAKDEKHLFHFCTYLRTCLEKTLSTKAVVFLLCTERGHVTAKKSTTVAKKMGTLSLEA